MERPPHPEIPIARGIERRLRHDRLIVLAALGALAALAWAYTSYLALGMEAVAHALAMPRDDAWSGAEFVVTLLMWAVMMAAMMLPSAAPMIAAYAQANRSRRAQGGPFAATGLFVAGYLALWFGFSLAACFAQWGLQAAALLSPMAMRAAPTVGGALLVAAGLFQWTPLKEVCLAKCRTPFGFIAAHWREGRRGAVVMGLHHGAYCLGCCWALMALLFVNGVMNLYWIAALAAVVLAEKLVPFGLWLSRALGALLIAWGVYLLTGMASGP